MVIHPKTAGCDPTNPNHACNPQYINTSDDIAFLRQCKDWCFVVWQMFFFFFCIKQISIVDLLSLQVVLFDPFKLIFIECSKLSLHLVTSKRCVLFVNFKLILFYRLWLHNVPLVISKSGLFSKKATISENSETNYMFQRASLFQKVTLTYTSSVF